MNNANQFGFLRRGIKSAVLSAFIMAATSWGAVPTIYHLDLSYTSGLSETDRYDVRHVAICLQGLANREAPRVFLTFSPDDTIWLTRLRESEGLSEGWDLVNLTLEQYLSIFMECAGGVVLYDPDPNTGIISSSLVATTAAGVENAIAIRKDTSAGSMYNYLVNDLDGPQLPVLMDLTGKFTGSGTIWQTSTPSTGSAKCDAYIWAKEKYIDTGKCDPTVLMYTLDLWGLKMDTEGKMGDDLRTQLSNLDYAVQKKGFCFELSPWGDEIATDDPGQPLGTDLDTFKKILNACNVQTGKSKMIKFCGFTNWEFKYTDHPNAGGLHGAVATEWETARLLSAYNSYLEADAPFENHIANSSFYSGLEPETKSRRYVQNPAPTYADLQAKGYINSGGSVVDGNYILIGMGDYDQASWTLNVLAAGIYDDSARGQVECSWGLNPNAIDRVSVAVDYMYRHKTDKDYFMAWDSGAGYVHPIQLHGTRSPSGYPSAVDVWQDHCRKYYRTLDYSISGWLLNYGSGLMNKTEEVDNYKSFSGDGIGFQAKNDVPSPSPQLRDNIPYQRMLIPGTGTISYSSGVHFGWEREIRWTPTQLKQKVDASASNQHFLNAYEYYYLMRYYQGGNNNHRATWISDTIPRIMAAGQVYPVTVTVRNDGWDTWSEAAFYRLAHAVLPEGSPVATSFNYDSTSPNRIVLPSGTTVYPNESVIFSFNITAPSVNGDYDLYYEMVHDGVTWFHLQNNIEWKKSIRVATNETDIDTDGDGVSDVVEEQTGSLYWHPDDLDPRSTVLLMDLAQTYDGSAKPVSYQTIPTGLAVYLTYDGAPDAPVSVGSYTVIGTINDAVYQSSTTNTLIIQTSAAYNAWKTEWFTVAERANPALSGPEAYYDSDEYSNYEEFIAGTDPTDGQSVPYYYLQPQAIAPGEYDYILNWSSTLGIKYTVNWAPDLLQPFTPLQTDLLGPQSSYTDRTHRVESKGFYQMKASERVPHPLITSATRYTKFNDPYTGIEGSSTDDFEGASITGHSDLYPNGGQPEDWFRSPNLTDVVFSDADSISFIEFHSATSLSLTSIEFFIGGDWDPADEGRIAQNIKFWASERSGDWNDYTLILDIPISPNPSDDPKIGSHKFLVSVDLPSVTGQYFRAEFTQNKGGARIQEIDAFSE